MKTLKITLFLALTTFSAAVYAQTESTGDAFNISKYDVIWYGAGRDGASAMPVGNGDLGAGVYTVANNDLYLLLSKTDAFDWWGNLLKTGRIRITMEPNPFRYSAISYKQTLNLANGCIDLHVYDSNNNDTVDVRIWVDANRPVYHVDIRSNMHLEIRVEPEFWRRKNGSWDTLETLDNKLVWYYTNDARSNFPDVLNYYDIEYMRDRHPDPFQYRTFGCALQVEGLKPQKNGFSGFGKSFHIEISSLTQQTQDIDGWKRDVCALLKPTDRQKSWKEHCTWWQSFWNRSWITASDNTVPENEREVYREGKPGLREEKDGGFIVAQSYNISRYIMACQGRGACQAQFNGGIFTMPLPRGNGVYVHEDERSWGNRFTFQNQRLLYWPTLMAGDFDIIKPFFNYYVSTLDLRKAITKTWFGHEGAYFRENLFLTGAESDDSPYSPNKPPKDIVGKPLTPGWYHNYHFNSGIELATMVLDYYRFTESVAFLNDTLAPLAREVLTFFDKHYPRDSKGKILLEPSQVLETWWVATNPMPDVAGLNYLVVELLKIKGLPSADRKIYERMAKQLPDIPIGDDNGKKYLMPAAKFSHKGNFENGELYAVFPYPLFGVGHNTEDIVAETMKRRDHKNSFDYSCWTQDQIDYAYAGMADEAADGLIHRWSHFSDIVRFPFFGKENPDYVPDLDHNGSGSTALQRMAVQEVGNKIYLLPAWPKTWDGSFRLHLSDKTIVEASMKGGKVTNWSVTPTSRKKDVIIRY